MAPLSHPNLVRLYGGCWSDGPDKLCIVLEFCARGTLKELLVATDVRKLQHDWAHPFYEISLGVASCFRYFHHEQPSGEALIHRDLKSDNVMLAHNFEAKVGDLGESIRFNVDAAKKRRGEIEGEDESYSLNLTMTLVGTPAYVAPEVLLGEPYNQSCDQYSFAIMCLEVGCRSHRFVLEQIGRAGRFANISIRSGGRGFRPKPNPTFKASQPDFWALIQASVFAKANQSRALKDTYCLVLNKTLLEPIFVDARSKSML